jgi:DNA-binding transcriptional MerR regulator
VNQTGAATARRRAAKSETAFRTIGEVVQELDLPAHVLRFWESKFPEVKPLKRSGGRRYYRPEDIDLLRRIRQHLYQEGYTIRGVQKLLSQGGLRGGETPKEAKPRPKLPPIEPAALPGEVAAGAGLTRLQLQKALEDVRAELFQIRALLDKLLAE